jgi:hypothetical protein
MVVTFLLSILSMGKTALKAFRTLSLRRSLLFRPFGSFLPRGKVVFTTMEHEFGHISLMVFPQVYKSQENKFKSSFMIIKGTMARREGTCNVVVNEVQPFNALEKIPQSKDWR